MIRAFTQCLAVCALIPLVWLFAVGFEPRAITTLDVPSVVRATRNTAVYAGAVTALVTLLAAPLSFLLARTSFSSRPLLATVLAFPASLPAVLLAMGAFDLFGQAAAGALGTCLVTAIAYLPWLLGPLNAALERCDPALEEAARLSGASATRAFFHASWPLVRRELAASTALVFSMTAATFAVPYFLGTLGRSPFPTLTTEMVEQVGFGGDGAFARALALALPLVVLSLGAAWFGERMARDAAADAGRPAQATRTQARGLLRLAVAAAWVYAGIGIAAPLLALLARATASDPTAAFTSARTLEAFVGLFAEGAIARASLDSLVLATASALVIVLISVLWMLGGEARASRRVFAVIYALPGTLIALALLFFAASRVRLVIAERVTVLVALQNTLAILGLAYVMKYLSAGIETTRAAFLRVTPALCEAARVCGASHARMERDVRLPLSLPAILAAGALLWMTFLPELTLSVLLFGPETPTLGTTLFELATYTNPREAAALAVVLVAACMVLHTLARHARGRVSG